MKRKIAFLTYSGAHSFLDKCPDFLDEYTLLKPYFSDLNSELVLVDWKDKNIGWKEFDTVIPKRCWDYGQHYSDFNSLIYKVIDSDTKIQNDSSIILWNMNKSYLVDLKKRGLPVADLAVVSKDSDDFVNDINRSIEKMFDRHNSSFFIVKPAIGAGGVDVVKFSVNEVSKVMPVFEKIRSYSNAIIQPFFPEIALDGEYSYFFFGSRFSHSIRKKPAEGNYLALQLYGAKNIKHEADESEIIKAYQFVKSVQPSCSYARVDVFKKNGELYLIELELIEPYLYFEHASDKSIMHFCQSVLS